MRQFTPVIEIDGPSYIAYCEEVPGANGQGRTREECLQNLREAIALILEDHAEGTDGERRDTDCETE